MQARMKTRKDTYTVDYPSAIEAIDRQMEILWFAEEMGVEKDENDVRSKMTEGERHGLITVLKLFTKYEIHIGEDWWSGKFYRMFPRPDIRRMANCFSFIEMNVHLPFYALLNETLNLANDEFYNSWKESQTLRDRIAFVEDGVKSEDDYEAIAAFAFMEGVVLFSSFAFLKSFNVNGFNMIPHIAAGVDSSAKDEHFHSMAAGWAFRQLMREEDELGLLSDSRKEALKGKVYSLAEKVYQHEEEIVEMIFSGGVIRPIDKEDILDFIKDRINFVLGQLGYEPMYKKDDGKVSEWFYAHLSSYKHSDFFANTQTQYVRNWAKHKLGFQIN